MSGLVRLLVLAVAATSIFWSLPGLGQEPYPSRTVKLVVPSAPGSTTDILARLVADQLGRRWGKTVIVENIAGGSMNIGATSVARSAPDGYTLMVAPPVPLSFSHLLHRNPGYDPTRFVPITILAKIPNVLVVRKDLPAATLKELIDYGKLNPGKLTYASGGAGSTAHLTAAQLGVQTGISMVHVVYRGAQPALSDIVAGHVDMFFDTLATSVPLYRDNKVKLLAVPDLQRTPAAPDVPTFSEAGLPAGAKTISVFLVNKRRPEQNDRVKDRAFAFQVRLELHAEVPFLARPDIRGLFTNDWDDEVADLQYRDSGEYSVGHNVSTEARLDGGVCQAARTCWIPRAEVERVEPPATIPNVELICKNDIRKVSISGSAIVSVK